MIGVKKSYNLEKVIRKTMKENKSDFINKIIKNKLIK
jgi:hypothetical protein